MSNRVADPVAHGVPQLAVSNASSSVNKTGSWKYIRPIYRDRVAPCNEGCPVGIDIEGYMNLLREDRIDEATELLLLENPMPATTGRVCYHPCENVCNRRSYDGSVSIHAVERMLGDTILDRPVPPTPTPTRSQTVAVVGSGPAGLACAFHLAGLGYGVTMFEAAEKPGGILHYGIPEYRLPKAILEKEIEHICARGVELRCGIRVGQDMEWEQLDRDYDAVFFAMGVHRSLPLRIEGEDAEGVRSGLAFLREVSGGARPDLGERVVVVGGGNTAMDCARTALRLGAEPLVLYRRTRAEMPAVDEEVEEALAEGIEFRYLSAPVAVVGRNGNVEGLKCMSMKLGEADASGRRRPVPVEGSEFLVPCDTVLKAIGEGPEFNDLPDSIDRDDWVVKTNPFGAGSRPGWFAGGDVIDQPHTVAHALGSGKRAAIGIDAYLKGLAGETVAEPDRETLRYGRIGNPSMTRWRESDPLSRTNAVNEVVPFEELNLDYFPAAVVNPDRSLDALAAGSGFEEVNRGLANDRAMLEARRCFNCGVCNQCEICLIFCPDLAISRRTDGPGFIIDYDYCKGCGVCDNECPRGAMAMTREGL